jgi:hypothetical protein
VIRRYSVHAMPPERLADRRGMFERFTANEHEFVVTLSQTTASAPPRWPAEAP